jgi:molecular chaperone DnaK (HSP70)
LAGLEVLTLINEPTAAAMAATSRMAHDGKVLVVDWGGGTLDVTALDSRSGVFIEQASSGIPLLGGKDFDSKFSAAVLEACPEVKWTASLRREFALDIERAKIRLSSDEFTNVPLPSGGLLRVTREMFDETTRPLVERLRRPIEQCLEMARWDPVVVDHVLLVGGTCKIPAVRALVQDILGRQPTAGVDPMTAVSEGAAVAAAIMTGELDNDFFVSTEHALGTVALDMSAGLEFSEIIGRGHKLPAIGRRTYVPIFDDQEVIQVQVVEGDPSLPLDHELNVVIASWEVELPPPDRGDNRSITLEYRYDVEGILHVRAIDDFTGDALFEDVAGSRTAKDREQLVRIANAVKSGSAEGGLQSAATRQSSDPEAIQLVQAARTKVAPFVDDREADEIRALASAVEAAGVDQINAAKEALRRALSRYSYLL